MSNQAQPHQAEKQPEVRIGIVVNGKPANVPAGLTVEGLLSELGIDRGRVAVEVDRSIVRKSDWAAAKVEAGAEVEIVQFVGGG